MQTADKEIVVARKREFLRDLKETTARHDLLEAEMALWLSQLRQTVHSWNDGALPRRMSEIAECTRRFRLLDASPHFPIPRTVSMRYRRRYIIEAFAHAQRTPVPPAGDA